MNFEIPFVKILKVPRGENEEEIKKNGVMAFPTIHFYKDGKMVEEVVGSLSIEELGAYFKKYLY